MDYFHPLDVTKRASEESRSKLNAKLADLPADTIAEVFPHLTRFLLLNLSQEELATNKEKTNRHLRLAELLQEHSSAAELIVMYGKHYYIETKTKTLCKHIANLPTTGHCQCRGVDTLRRLYISPGKQSSLS